MVRFPLVNTCLSVVSPVIFPWTGVRTVILDYPEISFVIFTFLNRCVSATSLPALEPSILVTVLVVALSIGTPYVSVNIMLNVTDWKGTCRLCYVNLVLWSLHLSWHNPELRWMPGCFLGFSAQTWMSGCMPPSYIPVCTGSGLPCKFHSPIFIGHFLVMLRGVWGSQVSPLMSVST